MKTIFKTGFALVVTLGYLAWAVWCYKEFGAEMTPECLGSWSFMVLCKLIVGVFVNGFWESSFNDDYGMPMMRNPLKPPNKYTKGDY